MLHQANKGHTSQTRLRQLALRMSAMLQAGLWVPLSHTAGSVFGSVDMARSDRAQNLCLQEIARLGDRPLLMYLGTVRASWWDPSCNDHVVHLHIGPACYHEVSARALQSSNVACVHK